MEQETIASGRPGTRDHVETLTRDERFTWFFRNEFRSVVRTAYVILHDAARAEDVAQDAFAQVYVHWRKVSRYERPEAWVRKVAIRSALKILRRDRLRQILERKTEPSAEAPHRPSVELIQAIGLLPPQQRAAVALFYLEDRPTSEVAEILCCSESTAKVHLFKARKRLAAMLAEEADDGV